MEPEWQHEELLQREQWELEHQLLKADPGYSEWLAKLEKDHEGRMEDDKRD